MLPLQGVVQSHYPMRRNLQACSMISPMQSILQIATAVYLPIIAAALIGVLLSLGLTRSGRMVRNEPVQELLKDGESVLLVNPADPQALADAIREALPALREVAQVVDAKTETVCRVLGQLLPGRGRPMPAKSPLAWAKTPQLSDVWAANHAPMGVAA